MLKLIALIVIATHFCTGKDVIAVQDSNPPQGCGTIAKFECTENLDFKTSYWIAPEGRLLAFRTQVIDSSDRYHAEYNETTGYVLKMKQFTVSDEHMYSCKDNSAARQDFQLTVNKVPEVVSEVVLDTVVDGNVQVVATCSALLHKPQAEIWFEDGEGVRVESLEREVEVAEAEQGLVNATARLSLEWKKRMNGKAYRCVVKHQDCHPISQDLLTVDVQYAPTMEMMDSDDAELSNATRIEVMEGEPVQVSCRADANPKPSIAWKFVRDTTEKKEAAEAANSTSPVEPTVTTEELPDGFQQSVSSDGSEVVLRGGYAMAGGLHNGTFICVVSNEIAESPMTESFTLAVYEIPTTTPAPTTTPQATSAPSFETLNTGGMSGLHISILVAAVLFIAIVVVIFVVRFFITHKGEYYTNELRATKSEGDDVNNGDGDSDDVIDDQDMMLTEAELLGQRKTEHFV